MLFFFIMNCVAVQRVDGRITYSNNELCDMMLILGEYRRNSAEAARQCVALSGPAAPRAGLYPWRRAKIKDVGQFPCGNTSSPDSATVSRAANSSSGS